VEVDLNLLQLAKVLQVCFITIPFFAFQCYVCTVASFLIQVCKMQRIPSAKYILNGAAQ